MPSRASDDQDATSPAETVLVTVPTGRLIVSILISRSGLLVEAALAALLVTVVVAPAAAAAVIGAGAFAILGLLAAVWRRFNSGYRLTVAEAPDGLRLRSGLLETAAETIRPGRVQGLRMVEPLLWRPLGWCRFEVDVAGSQKRKGENRSEGRQLRALLPVGSHTQARELLARLLPDAPRDRLPPPAAGAAESPASLPVSRVGHDADLRRRLDGPRRSYDRLGAAREAAEPALGAGTGTAQARARDDPSRHCGTQPESGDPGP